MDLVRAYKAEIDQCNKIIESIKNMVVGIKCTSDQLAISMNEIIKIYENIINENSKQIKSLTDTMNSLEGIERRIMQLRYIDGETWQDIADSLYISINTAHRYHRKAISKLQEK